MIAFVINVNCTKNIPDRTVAQSGTYYNMAAPPPEVSEALLGISMCVGTRGGQERLENHAQ